MFFQRATTCHTHARQWRLYFLSIMGWLLFISILPSGVTSALAGTPGTWEATGPIGTGRGYHTATLLPNGKVLIAGGFYGSDPISSAELYDPATGAFTPTGSMGTARAWHTATLLPDGKVLITGGHGVGRVPDALLATAELYDPATGTFTPTGSMPGARFRHTALLLPDMSGMYSPQVLITGGLNMLGYESGVALLYDPGTGSFTQAPSYMYSPRPGTATLTNNIRAIMVLLGSDESYDWLWNGYRIGLPLMEGYTATLLPNEKILIAGGLSSSAMLYDVGLTFNFPSGSATPTGSMSKSRTYHTATLLPDGEVLIVGGDEEAGSGNVTAELYDPLAGVFTPTGSVGNTEGRGHTATLLPNGKVLFVGIWATMLYTPPANGGVFSRVGSMVTARSSSVVVPLTNGKALIVSGSNNIVPSSELPDIYDPTTGMFKLATGPIGSGRTYFTVSPLPNGKVLVAGGRDSSNNLLSTTEVYDPSTGATAPTGSMSLSRINYSITPFPDGKILVAGGKDSSNNSLSTAELYDPATGAFSPTGSMGVAREGHGASVLADGKVLITGGGSTTVELYDPASGTFTPAGDMGDECSISGATATPLLNGKILLSGGSYPIKLYDLATGVCSPAGLMSIERSAHTATLLPNGKVLIAGGQTYNGSNVLCLSTAELYDPVTGTLTSTASMEFGRWGHTATLFPDGKVLIQGGRFINNALPTAELFQATSFGPEPDLVIDGISTNPSAPAPGENIIVTVTVRNQGAVAAGPFAVDIYTNASTAPLPLQTGDLSCASSGLAAGATYDCVVSASYGAEGSYALWAQVDTARQVAESNELNNVFGPQAMVVQITPVSITLVTIPAGRQIMVDGATSTAPLIVSWIPGSSHTIAVPSPQSDAPGTQYVYTSWSDGGAQSHAVTAPSTAATYTATLTTQYELATVVNPSGSGSVSPNCAGGCWYDSGAAVTLSATANTGYTFNAWSGAASGSTNPLDITLSAPTSVTANFITSSKADLVVSALSAPSTALPGSVITITDTTKNRGADPAGASTTRFFWSVDAVYDAGDTEIGSRPIPALAAGSVDAGSVSVTVPAGACSGTFYIIARADADGAIPEASETNNARSRPIKTGPDLRVTVLTAPATAGEGDSITVTDTVENRGDCAATASTTMFYLSSDSAYDAGDVYLGSRPVPSLAAGATDAGNSSITIPAGTPAGAYFLIAKADADNTVAELKETNNNRSRSIRIGPDLIVSAISAPAGAPRGATITVTDTTRNIGGGAAGDSTTMIYLSVAPAFDARTIPLGSRSIPALAPGATYLGSTTVTIPAGTPAGAYYIIAVSDAGGVVAESSETNNSRNKSITVTP